MPFTPYGFLFHLEPIIDRIALMALSLTNFTVNITFLTVGGETVTSFKVRQYTKSVDLYAVRTPEYIACLIMLDINCLFIM